MLTVGGLLVLQGRLSVGAMLAVNVYNTFLAVGLAQLAGSLGDLGKSLGSLQRCGVSRAGTTVLCERPMCYSKCSNCNTYLVTGLASRRVVLRYYLGFAAG